jgi:RimJ/RimL family protein N-acetyltransferase
MKNPFLEGERLYLRAIEPEDAPVVAACNNDPAVRLSFFTHTPTSVHLQRERISQFYTTGSDYIPFAICLKEDDSAIGVTAWHRVDHVSGAAVFSICLSDTTQWGKGYARESTHMMLYHAFEILNLHRVQLHVWEDNAAAIRTYEACGFKREGLLREAMRHNGRYCSFLVMGILEEEWRRL